MFAIGLFYLVSYTSTDAHVFWLFGTALFLILLGLFVKEALLCPDSDFGFWFYMYLALHILAFLLIIAGITYASFNSNLPWFVWALFGIGLIITVLGNMFYLLMSCDELWALITYIIGFAILIIALAYLISFGPDALNLDLTLSSTYWLWLFIAATVAIGILMAIFEGYASIPEECECLN
jgi:hypothetical protein